MFRQKDDNNILRIALKMENNAQIPSIYDKVLVAHELVSYCRMLILLLAGKEFNPSLTISAVSVKEAK